MLLRAGAAWRRAFSQYETIYPINLPMSNHLRKEKHRLRTDILIDLGSINRLDSLRRSNCKRILDGGVSPMERYELLPIIERLERIGAKIDKIYIDDRMTTKQVSV